MSIQHQISLSTEQAEALEYAMYRYLNPDGFTPTEPTIKMYERLSPILDALRAAMAAEKYESMMETREQLDPGGTT